MENSKMKKMMSVVGLTAALIMGLGNEGWTMMDDGNEILKGKKTVCRPLFDYIFDSKIDSDFFQSMALSHSVQYSNYDVQYAAKHDYALTNHLNKIKSKSVCEILTTCSSLMKSEMVNIPKESCLIAIDNIDQTIIPYVKLHGMDQNKSLTKYIMDFYVTLR